VVAPPNGHHGTSCRHAEPSGRPATQGHRDRPGLRCRQTSLTRSIFPDPKTHSSRGFSGRSDRDGGRAESSAWAAIGPPTQHVSRIAPHWRQMSFARISWVSPEQIGQRQVLMGESIRQRLTACRGLWLARREGLPVPLLRTFTAGIRPSAHSRLPALRHPVCACLQRRLPGHGQPLAPRSHRFLTCVPFRVASIPVPCESRPAVRPRANHTGRSIWWWFASRRWAWAAAA